MIYCCGCQQDVKPRLTTAAEIYPHRPDLAEIPMWRCDDCGNYVGCHHKTSKPTRPLGNIPTAEIRKARKHIHRLIDPVWESGQMKRGKLYARISKELGYSYHTGEITTVDQARRIYRVAQKLIKDLASETK